MSVEGSSGWRWEKNVREEERTGTEEERKNGTGHTERVQGMRDATPINDTLENVLKGRMTLDHAHGRAWREDAVGLQMTGRPSTCIVS